MSDARLPAGIAWRSELVSAASAATAATHGNLLSIFANANIESFDRFCYICQGEYMKDVSPRRERKADQVSQLEELFKALADTTRLRILRLLMAGEACVCDIHDTLKIPQAKASRHLAYLRRAGLVTTRREGLWIHYSLSKSADPIVATIEDATIHVLGHVESLKKDAVRFEKRTGCCAPVSGATGLACCAQGPHTHR